MHDRVRQPPELIENELQSIMQECTLHAGVTVLDYGQKRTYQHMVI